MCSWLFVGIWIAQGAQNRRCGPLGVSHCITADVSPALMGAGFVLRPRTIVSSEMAELRRKRDVLHFTGSVRGRELRSAEWSATSVAVVCDLSRIRAPSKIVLLGDVLVRQAPYGDAVIRFRDSRECFRARSYEH